MVRGILIPAVPFLPPVEREFAGLADYQDAVGGYIEPVLIASPPLTMYVNEEGKVRKRTVNPRATMLWWLFTPAARGHDLVVGDAVVTSDDPGDSELLLELLPGESTFRVEVQVADAAGLWVQGPNHFPTWFAAAEFALALDHRFPFVEDVRVMTA